MKQIIENGIPAGNAYDKYTTRNPIAKALMRGFLGSVVAMIRRHAIEVDSIVEIGCGEGYVTSCINHLGIAPIRGFDRSEKIIERARLLNPGIEFIVADLFEHELVEMNLGADLVVCCEVMEHVDDPNLALEKLDTLCGKFVLISVPREPLWRILNMMRGKYILKCGNTIGHLNHWSANSFVEFVRQRFEVVEVQTPLPWTLVFCKKISQVR